MYTFIDFIKFRIKNFSQLENKVLEVSADDFIKFTNQEPLPHCTPGQLEIFNNTYTQLTHYVAMDINQGLNFKELTHEQSIEAADKQMEKKAYQMEKTNPDIAL